MYQLYTVQQSLGDATSVSILLLQILTTVFYLMCLFWLD